MSSQQPPEGTAIAANGETRWHSLTVAEVSERLGSNAESGLNEEEAARRLTQYGPNQLEAEKKETVFDVFWEEVREPMILLLLVTGVLYAIWGALTDTITIFLVILALVSAEVYNEYRAKVAIGELRKLSEPTVPVLRGGEYQEVPTENVVPGDLIVLQAGRRVPADGRLVQAYGLAADESSLTGESVPVDKEAGAKLAEDAALAERRNLVFSGTQIARGRGEALVTTTGAQTEFGRIVGLAREAKFRRTPLQNLMRGMTRYLAWVAIGFSAVVPLLGYFLAHESPRQMVLTGLSLAFSVIPEELPIIITMVLALGAYRLSRRRAIVKYLWAAEALGSVSVIVTDKTGTLTENHMEVSRLQPEAQSQQILQTAALCNDAIESEGGFKGDPMDVGLLQAAKAAGVDARNLNGTYPLRAEFTFDNVRKRMSTVRSQNGQLLVAVKGAPEAILALSTRQGAVDSSQPLSDADRQAILDSASQMASDGLRVIALAQKLVPDAQLSQEQAESDLTFVGLAGLADPPRPEAKQAIADCRSAGIRPIMVTGDHPRTALAVAREVGLADDSQIMTGPELDKLSDAELEAQVGTTSVFARTAPEHKLRIVQALHRLGQRVTVTGDGVNDAPALAAADIGVAMGETGTDVAREAAAMVLADDNFATIVDAVREGRGLFANLKKGVRYYLACKLALVSVTLLPVLLSVPVPFAPIQIILMELFMDLAASAAFSAEPPESDLMKRTPRDPAAPFMDRPMVGSIFGAAFGLFAGVSATYLVTWYGGASIVTAQTMAFIAWLSGHVFLALNLRSDREPLVRLGLLSNRVMVVWALGTALLIVLATLVPATQGALKTVSLTGMEWALALGTVFVGTFWIEVAKWLGLRLS